MLKKAAFILVLLLLSSCVVFAGEGDFKALRITTHELAYANLYKGISIPGGAKAICLEYSIKVEKLMGYASGPAVHLWWNSGQYIATKVDYVGSKSSPGGLRLMTPARVFLGKDICPVEEGVWYRHKMEMTADEIVILVQKITPNPCFSSAL